MPHRLMLIGAAPRSVNGTLRSLLASERSISCEARTWDRFQPESLEGWQGDLVVAEANGEPTGLLRLVNWAHGRARRIPMLVILSEDMPEDVVQTVGAAVDDFMFTPVRSSELRHRLARLLGPVRNDPQIVETQLLEQAALAHFVGRHSGFVQMVQRIPLMARSNAPVLLVGETGTGKELCARAIHHLSPRKAGPFVPIECGALPEHLVENELFGHSRGAFTDARSDQKGLVAMAEGGTLFLDEVDSLSLAAQSKLLRFLQERTYKALGSDRFACSNVRIVAATNRDLEMCIREHRFRNDLYFRINVLRLELPPLRERRCDIPLLTEHFLRSLAEETGTHPKLLSTSALRLLEQYDWPGNIRELVNVLQRAAILAPGCKILPAHLGIPIQASESDDGQVRFNHARTQALEKFERAYLERMLRRHQGNITRSAQEAGKDRRAFGRLVKKYHIDRLNP